MPSRRSLVLALPALGLAGLPLAAGAQTYPDKPIRIIVPVAPGSGTDLVSRQVALMLTKMWNGVSVVVDNRPGAGGIVGADAVAKAPADGYTLLFDLSSHYTSPLLAKAPYDPVSDFEPIARMASTALVVVTAVDSPFKTVQDVIDAARRAPRTVSFATAGDGTTSHMAGALLSSLARIELVHTPYKNGSQAMVDTSSGQVHFAFSGPAALPLVRAGKLRVLATTGTQRSALLPDVPTVKEAARLDGYEVIGPIWAFAPKGTPAAIVAKLSETFRTIAETAEFKQFCALQSLDPDFEPSDKMRAGQAAELAKWRTLVQLVKN